MDFFVVLGRGKHLFGETSKPSDSRGRLELASAAEVGLKWKYSGSTYTNPAQNLFVPVES